MEAKITCSDVAPDQVTTPGCNTTFASISQLLIELLANIFQLSLHEVDFKSKSISSTSRSNVKRLYCIRAVTKRWKGIIEGTPSFWTTVVSSLPLYVNEASILLSSNLPLSVISYRPEPGNPVVHPSDAKFLKLIEHTRSRWSVMVLGLYDSTSMSEYLRAPLPLLHTIIVRSTRFIFSFEPELKLLGGDRTNLRFVHISGVSILWSAGRFAQLKCLTLKNVAHDGLTGGELLDTISASPGLQVLNLEGIKTEIPLHSPTITLHHLRCIKLSFCAIHLVEYVLRQIRAPSCTRLCLTIGDEQGFDVPHFLKETFKSFHGTLRTIHQRLGESDLELDFGKFMWHTPDQSKMEGFSIYISGYFDPFSVRWVDSILRGGPGLRISFGDGGCDSEAMLRGVAPMQSVTKARIKDSRRATSIRAALQFLGKPLQTSTSLPSLPYLQELHLPPGGWDTRDVLEMVQSRFYACQWKDMDRTPLTIDMQRRWYERGYTPKKIPDLPTIVQIRKTNGVQCVKLVEEDDPVGMLAEVWKDEGSEPI
ncbi:hypothetical protein FS837_004127 [Tulasnella sp. UAMH 9824]|nr:hypothetical protein FS837_004127 [Tulasnella sp. UAMH 9824]